MFNLFSRKGVLLSIVCIVAISFCCNAQKPYQYERKGLGVTVPIPKIKMHPLNSEIWEYISSTYIRRGVYDVQLCRAGEGMIVKRYNSHTWKKKTKFHRFYRAEFSADRVKLIPL